MLVSGHSIRKHELRRVNNDSIGHRRKNRHSPAGMSCPSRIATCISPLAITLLAWSQTIGSCRNDMNIHAKPLAPAEMYGYLCRTIGSCRYDMDIYAKAWLLQKRYGYICQTICSCRNDVYIYAKPLVPAEMACISLPHHWLKRYPLYITCQSPHRRSVLVKIIFIYHVYLSCLPIFFTSNLS